MNTKESSELFLKVFWSNHGGVLRKIIGNHPQAEISKKLRKEFLQKKIPKELKQETSENFIKKSSDGFRKKLSEEFLGKFMINYWGNLWWLIRVISESLLEGSLEGLSETILLQFLEKLLKELLWTRRNFCRLRSFSNNYWIMYRRNSWREPRWFLHTISIGLRNYRKNYGRNPRRNSWKDH